MHNVNSLKSAREALRQGVLALQSPPFAACHAGVLYYRKLLDALTAEFPDVPFTFTLCCGDDPAIAYEALRLGFKHIRCECPPAQLEELQAVAHHHHARLADT